MGTGVMKRIMTLPYSGLLVVCCLSGCATTRPPDFTVAESGNVSDIYYESGIAAAYAEYRGTGAYIGGLATVTALPLALATTDVDVVAGGSILGLTYVGAKIAMKSNKPAIPAYHLDGLTQDEREYFTRGYLDHVSARRNENYVSGIMAGLMVDMFLFIMLISSLSAGYS